MSALVKAFRRAPPDVRANLLALARSLQEEERIAAVRNLGASGFLPAVEFMVEKIQDGSLELVVETVRAVERLSPTLTIEAVKKLRASHPPAFIQAVRQRLGHLHTTDPLPDPGDRSVNECTPAELVLFNPSVTERARFWQRLTGELSNPSAEARRLVIDRLVWLRTDVAAQGVFRSTAMTDDLVTAMLAAAPDVSSELLHSLFRADPQDAVLVAEHLLNSADKSDEHGVAAARFLVNDAGQGIHPLACLVRRTAKRQVQLLGGAIARFRFEEALGFCRSEIAGQDDMDRLHAARFAGLIGKYTWEDPPDAELEVRRQRCATILAPLLRDPSPAIRKMALTALSEHHWPEVGQEAARMLKDNFREIRQLSVEILGAMGGPSVFQLIWERRHDAFESVRKTVLETAVQLAPERKTEIALSFLTRLETRLCKPTSSRPSSTTCCPRTIASSKFQPSQGR